MQANGSSFDSSTVFPGGRSSSGVGGTMGVVACVLLGVGVALGTPGNVMVMLFFGRECKRRLAASLVLILAIAAVDLLTCSFFIPYTICIICGVQIPNSLKIFVRLLLSWSAYVTLCFVNATAWERYMAVCRAASFRNSLRRVVACCVVSTVVSFVLGCLSVFPVRSPTVTPNMGALYRYNIGYIFVGLTFLTVVVLYALVWRTLFLQNRIGNNSTMPREERDRTREVDQTGRVASVSARIVTDSLRQNQEQPSTSTRTSRCTGSEITNPNVVYPTQQQMQVNQQMSVRRQHAHAHA